MAVAGERAGGRAGEERSALHPSRESRAKLQRKDLVPGLVGEVPGSASCIRETQRLERRGAQSAAAAAHAARGSWWSSTRAAKEASHTRQVFAHAHAGEDGQVLVLLEVRYLHRTTGERACGSRSRAEPGRSTSKAQGWQKPKETDAGWRSPPGLRWAGRTWSKWLRRKLDGTGVMWLMSWSALGSAWTGLKRVTVVLGRAQFCWTSSVAGAVSLIRTSSQKRRWHFGLAPQESEVTCRSGVPRDRESHTEPMDRRVTANHAQPYRRKSNHAHDEMRVSTCGGECSELTHICTYIHTHTTSQTLTTSTTTICGSGHAEDLSLHNFVFVV